MDFLVCDDFVPPEMADQIERTMTVGGFPWFYYPNVNSVVRKEDRPNHPTVIYDETQFDESFGFSTLIFPGEEANPPFFEHPKRVFELFLEKQSFRVEQLLRVKANLLVRTPGARPFSPHVDMPRPHWVLIYYVNDSDGDTVIFDNLFPNRDHPTVFQRVSPKKGRAVMFDGRHYHSGTCPSEHDTRIVFNYDFA